MHIHSNRISAPFVAACVGLALAAGAAPPDTSCFPFMKELRAPTNASQGIASFVVDEEMLASTADDFSNMRVFDSRNEETPFLVRAIKRRKPVITETQVQMTATSFDQLTSNKVEIVLRNETSNSTPCAMVILTKQRNFEKYVTVLGSTNHVIWEVLALCSPVFDYSRYIDLRNDRVEIKAGQYPYYKVEVFNFTEAYKSPLTTIVKNKRRGEVTGETEQSSFMTDDFRIEGVKFLEKKESHVEDKSVTRQYPVHNLCVTNDTKNKETIVYVNSDGAPITSLTIFARDPNFSRGVEVYGADLLKGLHVRGVSDVETPNEWERITEANISMVNIGGFRQERKTIELARPCRYHRYKMVIRNMDSPPLAVYGMKAEGQALEALFFCNPNRKYRLLYGAKNLDAPQYDIAAVLGKTTGADTDTYLAAHRQPNPQVDPRKLEEPRRLAVTSKRLLVGAVLLMVATLAWLIATAAKDVNRK